MNIRQFIHAAKTFEPTKEQVKALEDRLKVAESKFEKQQGNREEFLNRKYTI